ncbi:MAG TPA: oligosaccharide flippase family protein, partial [Polyangiaceae bacterium]
RNTLYLTLSQAVTVPLAVLVNALTARYLGAESFGYIYLASTFASFGSLAVGWGHEGVLPAMVAQDRSLAGVLLGSSFAWRASLSLIVYAVMAGICRLLHYNAELQWALALTFLGAVLALFVAACKDTIRGFERADIPAYAHVGQQFLWAALVVGALLLGGRMRAVLAALNVALVVVFVLVMRTLPAVGVGKLSVRQSALKSLFVGGTPFVFFSLASALQPIIDAIYLSKLGSLEAVGWFAVARRLIGVLLFPASALIGALYPTLCRLSLEDKSEFNRVARGSLHSVALVAIPIALGCGLYPDVAIAIFSKQAFGPAADDLRILSVFLFLVYFTMPIGTCVLAAGKQKAWSLVQCICVVVSLGLDPLLTPWFQRRFGNGGLGPCVASVVSEVVVVGCGLTMMPAGIFDARLRRTLAFALLAGLAMALAARLTSSLSPFIGAPLGVLAYAAALYATGEIDRAHLEKIRNFVARKRGRGAT